MQNICTFRKQREYRFCSDICVCTSFLQWLCRRFGSDKIVKKSIPLSLPPICFLFLEKNNFKEGTSYTVTSAYIFWNFCAYFFMKSMYLTIFWVQLITFYWSFYSMWNQNFLWQFFGWLFGFLMWFLKNIRKWSYSSYPFRTSYWTWNIFPVLVYLLEAEDEQIIFSEGCHHC